MIMTEEKIKVTLVRSPIGQKKKIKATLESLGLRKLQRSVVVKNNPQMRGMLKKVIHMIKIELI